MAEVELAEVEPVEHETTAASTHHHIQRKGATITYQNVTT